MLKFPLQDPEPDAGHVPAGVGADTTPTKGPVSPNEGWQDDPNLDANGNPLETPAAQPATEPEAESVAEPASEETNDETTEETQALTVDEANANFAELATESVGAQVTTLLTEAGLNATEVAKSGTVSPAVAKALVAKHGETVAGLLISQLKALNAAAVGKRQAAENAVFSQVEEHFAGVTEQSGKQSFAELRTWAQSAIPKPERDAINKMLGAGGYEATLAVNSLVEKFKASDKFNQQPKLQAGKNEQKSSRSVKAITRQEYTAQLRVLESKGHVYGTSSEMAKLDSQRNAGIKAGM